MIDRTNKRATTLAYIKTIHTGSIRGKGGEPDWHHLDRVSRLIEVVLSYTQEGTIKEREDMALAALGHDALEDTSVTCAELEVVFGERGLELIEDMTNRQSDADQCRYVRQIASADEQVRIIKLADLIDNSLSVTHQLFVLGSAWCDNYFLPIIMPMIEAVTKTEFTIFHRSGEILKRLAISARDILLEENERYRLEEK